ncbi:MAG: TIGR04013 family B12-binding domain/radical SAM domain-containing protein [Candidatus Methanoperedens sp.]|nr:TIGR04013 family B12-binding domain/radical SAM domain-containing protein [Candidatus Methanoperedens sp.]CAG0973100.1 Bacteriochlorophyllide d C-8(2)-methyltransferase [Methanosarcinales archaeon]
MNKINQINFRFFKKNMQSIAVLMPLVPGSYAAERPCDGIMIYSFTTQQAPTIFREVSQATKKSLFVAGGPHPSSRPEETLRFFDYVVIGEGEETLPELIDVIQNKGDISSVKGISYKNEAEDIVFTEKRSQVDLDKFPPFDPGIMLNTIEITRGCPFNCAYCQTPQLFGHNMRHRSIDVISKYSKFLKDIRFTSPNAFAYGSDGIHPRIEKIESLLRALQPGRIFFGTFPSEVRPEFINDSILELVSKYCRNSTISMGGQSGSQGILESIKRKHTVEDIIIGAEKCLEHGFNPIVDFIFGLPGETEADQLETIKVIKWLTGKGGNVHSHYFMPLPGTEFENSTPAPLSKEVEKVMGDLALNRKTTGVWS